MDKYIKTMLEQIRCKKVHPFIEDEIKGHIEDQIEANLLDGLSQEEAEREAVRDMGDPVETGVSFDRVHRPKMAWGILAIIGIISIFGIFIHMMISHDSAAYEAGYHTLYNSTGYIKGVIIGLLAMGIIYFIDYTVIARYSKILAVIFMAVCIVVSYGTRGFLGIRFIVGNMMLLYVPLYGAILYKYKGKEVSGIIKSILWMLVPVLMVFEIPNLAYAMLMYAAMCVLLILAIIKGWFNVNKIKTAVVTSSLLFVCPVLPVALMYIFHGFAEYQMARITAFIHGDSEAYLTNKLKELHEASGMLGNGSKEIYEFLPDYNTDYIYTYIASVYGIFVATIVCTVFVIMIIYIISQLLKQKNQLGQSMGLGAILILTLLTVTNILANMGVIPLFQTFFPFLSAGTAAGLVSYSLVGVILSVYRYKDIYPKHVDVNRKKSITINFKM